MDNVVLKAPSAMPSTNVNALRDTTCSKENVPHVSLINELPHTITSMCLVKIV